MRKIKLLLFGFALTALLAVPGAAMAKSHDRDHDKLPDKWEKKFHLSTHHKSGKGDPDRDGLTNRGEFRSGTNPRRADSDHDGVRDGAEDRDHDGLSNSGEGRTGNDPSDRDSDDNGVRDGDENAGTIVSFTEDSSAPGTGVLVIRRTDNSTLTANVTHATKLECERTGDDNSPATHEKHGADDGPNHDAGDDHGDDGPNHDAGDDHGDDGPNHDAGDDHGNCTSADLTPGTVVHEAELAGTGDDATLFAKVELLK